MWSEKGVCFRCRLTCPGIDFQQLPEFSLAKSFSLFLYVIEIILLPLTKIVFK